MFAATLRVRKEGRGLAARRHTGTQIEAGCFFIAEDIRWILVNLSSLSRQTVMVDLIRKSNWNILCPVGCCRAARCAANCSNSNSADLLSFPFTSQSRSPGAAIVDSHLLCLPEGKIKEGNHYCISCSAVMPRAMPGHQMIIYRRRSCYF